MNLEFGDTLKRLRKIYGYTGKSFSEELNISRSYLSELENNKKTPSVDLLEKMANKLDIPVSTFILLSESNDSMKSKKLSEKFIRQWYLKVINNKTNMME